MINAGNTQQAMMLALEVKRVQLPDALGICLLFSTDQDAGIPPRCGSWLARFVADVCPGA